MNKGNKRMPLVYMSKGKTLWQDERIEIAVLDGFDDEFIISSLGNPERYIIVNSNQLNSCNHAVSKPELEISSCPFCEGECSVITHKYDGRDYYAITCVSLEIGCGYMSQWNTEKNEAINKHNLLPRGSDD